MEKGELLEFLKENLTIETEESIDFYGNSKTIEVKLLLGGEVISSDYIEIDTNNK